MQLTNGRLSSRITVAGTGQLWFGDFVLTRWTADRTREVDGVWLYVRDLDNDTLWSATMMPVPVVPDSYEVCASSAIAAIRRRDGDIAITTEICVAPDDAELRRYTLTNHGLAARRLELTTCAEVVLNTAAADAAHPAFSKLFVQTEWLVKHQALLAKRRLRSPHDEPLWLAHSLVTEVAEALPEYETDRSAFIGRGRSTARPHALSPGVSLGGGVGSVLDPLLALRRTVVLEPGTTVRVAAVLAAGDARKDVEATVARYSTVGATDDSFARAAAAGEQLRVPVTIQVPGEQRFRPVVVSSGGSSGDEMGGEPLTFFNGHGGFSPDGSEYVIRVGRGARGDSLPPAPWVNVVANEQTGFIASELGTGCSWSVNSRENRLTPWSNDPVCDPLSEAIYIRDDDAGDFWTATPGPIPGDGGYEVRHGFGYTSWRHTGRELEHEVTQWVARRDPVKLTRLRLTNRGSRPRRITVASFAQLVLGGLPFESGATVVTERDPGAGVILAWNPARDEFAPRVAVGAVLEHGAVVEYTTDRRSFLGSAGSMEAPAALTAGSALDGATGGGLDPCIAFQFALSLAPGETVERTFLLGEGDSRGSALTLARAYSSAAAVEASLNEVRAFWDGLLTRVRVRTPSPELDLMVNGWLQYQNLGCRMWGRTAFYQSGGAFGFRDQLQDSSALVYLAPELTRQQIAVHASHQFVEGDVLHWWHPPTSKGIRTRFSDDLLWLPYITSFYVGSTGDNSVLSEQARFLTAAALEPGEDELFLLPSDSGTSASIYEHCCLALDRSLTAGAHGLPLIGVGDWNDGMNRVGREGKGESVWLGFFLYSILGDFIPFCEQRGDAARVARYTGYRERLHVALNDTGWDGEWYRRAYYDDGTPIGSAESDECRIDTIAQAWAVISGAAPVERAEAALDAMEVQLVSEEDSLIRLLTPPFDRTPHDPGYIKGYIPGVRENGGQYTHAALWAVRALAELGRSERAAPLLAMLSPVSHGRTAEETGVYRAEPYVIAADVYGVEPHVGRGGWSWYTGSAGWMFRVALESVLGLRLVDGVRMELRPCIPVSWPGFGLSYRLPHDDTTYDLVVKRAPDGADTSLIVSGRVEPAVVVAGALHIPLVRDGALHRVEILLGSDVGVRYPSLPTPSTSP